jgi:hypothetical protein
MGLAEPGCRIVRVQLVRGLLSGISMTFLEDAYRPFTHALDLDKLIAAAFIPPVKGFPAKLTPLRFEKIFVQIHASFS